MKYLICVFTIIFIFLTIPNAVFAATWSAVSNITVVVALPEKPDVNETLYLDLYEKDSGGETYPLIKTLSIPLVKGEGQIKLDDLKDTEYTLSSDNALNRNFEKKEEIFKGGEAVTFYIDYAVPVPTSPGIGPTGGSTSAPTGGVTTTSPGGSTAAGSGSTGFNYTMTEPTLAQYGPSDWYVLGTRVIDLLAWIVGSIFVGVLLVGGVMIITAGGNEAQAESGKKTVFAAIIGVVIVALAWTVVSFIVGAIQ